MANLLLQTYWRLPYWGKRWAASLASRKWDRERHGKHYSRVLGEIAEQDRWSREQLEDYQAARLREIVLRAATNVPYYVRSFSEAGINPGHVYSAAELPSLPILEKSTVRREGEALVDRSLDRTTLLSMHTSGTTGSPLRLFCNARIESARFAYAEARWHAVAGMQRRRNRSISIGGHLVCAPDRTTPPYWVVNARWNQLYMSSYHLSDTRLPDYYRAVREFAADYIEGYPSSVYALARFIVERGLAPVPLQACFTTAEVLFDYQREAIQKAFGCLTYDQYGCTEMVAFAAECQAGRMHLSPEMGIVEVLDNQDRPVPCGETGTFVCTGLVNDVQPLIRYRLGDTGSLSSEDCTCGSPLPLLGQVEGRVDAVLLTLDGRRIGRLDPVFKGVRCVAEAQIVQDDWEIFRIRVVPGDGYSDDDGALARANLQERVGRRAQISVEVVNRIERTRAGKFPAVVCNLPRTAPGQDTTARPPDIFQGRDRDE